MRPISFRGDVVTESRAGGPRAAEPAADRGAGPGRRKRPSSRENRVPVGQGESAPATEAAALGDRTSMLFFFSATLVAAGTGRGVVAMTGRRPRSAGISGMLGRVEPLTTPLWRRWTGSRAG